LLSFILKKLNKRKQKIIFKAKKLVLNQKRHFFDSVPLFNKKLILFNYFSW